MKKVWKLICIAIIAAFMVVLVVLNNSNAEGQFVISASPSKSEVVEGETFSVTFSFSPITSITGSINHSDNVSIIDASGINSETGYFAFTSESPISSFVVQFKAKESVSNTDVAISLSDVDVPNSDATGYLEVAAESVNIKINKTTPAPETLQVTPTEITSLAVGASMGLSINKSEGVTCTSSNPGVASVTNSGMISAISEGDTVITVTDGTTIITIPVRVNGNGQPGEDNFEITSSAEVSISVNETSKITTNKSSGVTFTSGAPEIASVSDDGTITGLQVGVATINVSYGSENKVVAVNVTSQGPTPIQEAPVLTPETLTLDVGGKGTISCNQNVTFEIIENNNEAISISSNNGTSTEVNALKEGTAKIKGTNSYGDSNVVTITVSATPQRIDPPQISPDATTIEVDETTAILVVNGVDVNWTIGTPSVLKIAESKERAVAVTGLSAGKSKVTATNSKGESISVTIVVKEKAKEPDLIVTPTGAVLKVGETVQLKSNQQMQAWQSSNANIATVNPANGLVTAVSAGETTIYGVSANGKNAIVNIKVIAKEVPNNVVVPKLTPSGNVTLTVGTVKQMKADSSKVYWDSSDLSVVTVDANGKLKALKAGKATITCTNSEGGSTSFTVTVTKELVQPDKNANGNQTNSSSIVNGDVPSTGEGSTEALIIFAIVTLIIAAIVFKKKSKM